MVGGAGYVGGWMTDEMIAAGHEVIVYDNLLYEDLYLKPVKLVYGNVLDYCSLQPLLLWADVVVWLAALVGDPACALNPDQTIQVNVESVQHLVRSFRGRILFPSTCSVYGAQEDELTEDSQPQPLSLYAEAKLKAETVLLDSGSNAMIFRLGTLYGLSDTYSRLRLDLVLNALTTQACLVGRVSVYGGSQYRPMIHVRDVATTFVPNVATNYRGIYNLHSDNVTILEIAQSVQRELPGTEILQTEIRYQDARNYRVSSDRARTHFGLRPKWSLMDGVREVADVVLGGRIRDTSMPRFSNIAALRSVLRQDHNPLWSVQSASYRREVPTQSVVA
jgi:nucleoside-diphosphate-sugar epimerase